MNLSPVEARGERKEKSPGKLSFWKGYVLTSKAILYSEKRDREREEDSLYEHNHSGLVSDSL